MYGNQNLKSGRNCVTTLLISVVQVQVQVTLALVPAHLSERLGGLGGRRYGLLDVVRCEVAYHALVRRQGPDAEDAAISISD